MWGPPYLGFHDGRIQQGPQDGFRGRQRLVPPVAMWIPRMGWSIPPRPPPSSSAHRCERAQRTGHVAAVRLGGKAVADNLLLGLTVHSAAPGFPATWEAPGDKRQEGSVSGFGSNTPQEVFGRALNCPVGPTTQASVPGSQLPCSRPRPRSNGCRGFRLNA